MTSILQRANKILPVELVDEIFAVLLSGKGRVVLLVGFDLTSVSGQFFLVLG